MREIFAGIGEGDEGCRLAFDVYIHRLAAAIAAMAAAMGGLDALVFTGGVGENSDRVRTAAVARMDFLGIGLDPRLNAEADGDQRLSDASAAVPVVVVQAREDLEIGAQVRRALFPTT